MAMKMGQLMTTVFGFNLDRATCNLVKALPQNDRHLRAVRSTRDSSFSHE